MSDSTTCGNCGQTPVGEGCYNLCFNSVHYYSPEQERADDVFYGDDDHRERYAAEMDPVQYMEDPEDIAYYEASLQQDTLRPDMDEFYGQFEAHHDNDDIPF